MIRLRCRIAALLLAVALTLPAAADPIPLVATPVELLPGHPETTRIGRLEYRGGLHLVSRDSRFGGVSGLEALPDGRLLGITDAGWWFTFRPVLDARGHLVGAQDGDLQSLNDERGRPLVGKPLTDAESLRRDASGDLLVSFERTHRVLRYTAMGGAGVPIPVPPDVAGQPDNGGIEAMAVWPATADRPEGRLLMISEQARNAEGDLKAWLRIDGAWHALSYALQGEGLPTDAAVLPSGDLVVLERKFGLFTSLGARVVRVPAAQVVPGGKLVGETLAQWEAPLSVDNMEGLATARGPDGATLLWIVSDDNFRRSQRTLLMLFKVD
ncbi:MAG: esterase-like activity of phytase family protein [Alphaproteobacteria bacterium]|nr:esterase-like activity of phytase family protein [Alphaproteobacteria bacterium]